MSQNAKSALVRERLITKKELAERLHLSIRSIERKIDEGAIPGGFKLGAAVRWRESVIDQWIEGGCPRVMLSGSPESEATGPKVKGAR
jgi:excisionase family DNA binding protein